jgi:hypothetical protein
MFNGRLAYHFRILTTHDWPINHTFTVDLNIIIRF